MSSRRVDLVARRNQVGFSQETLAEQLGVARESIARWERGEATPRAKHRPPLARLLQITLPELERLLATDMARLAPDGHSVPPWLDHFASLEQGATRVQTFEPFTVPGLLQTPAYIEAVMRAHWRPLSETAIADRVKARIARQAVLVRRPEPLELICIIDESVLHRQTGGADVMAEQINHLFNASQQPSVHLQIVPSQSPAVNNVVCGSFWMFASEATMAPYMICTQGLAGFNYYDGLGAIESHVELFHYLARVSLTADQSDELLSTTVERYRCLNRTPTKI
ncbi:MAG: helix-turn-helix transcriptional regulator [Actinomycetia bacterium]|nr:helix-turn-helix transcriptional regulator [Actinomycetes bacterium]MCP4222642.1 helix-turn-helix transcriptional regulator [Actinomycetes bacterium]MCP5035646.1 helix-turn-helix transcriptional regulator [Actinomycetes bacterium]